MRTWILAGVALVLLGFAVTLAVDLLEVQPERTDLAVTPPPVVVGSEGLRATVLERDTESAAPARRGEARDGDAGAAAAARRARPKEETRRHPDGSVRDVVELDDDGRPHGRYASFHPGGAPFEEGAFEHGQKQGVWRSYHENGALRDECTWENGVQRGRLRQWDLEGHLVREAQIDGQLEGLCTTWYASGQLESRGSYSAGRREGRFEYWQPDGAMDAARTGTYQADQRVGD